jgi:hypothetical protein
MFKSNKRRAGVALGLILALAVAGGAYAYWTAGGSGTGSGTAATGTTPVTAVQTTTLTPFYPGDSAQTISGNFTNTNSGPVYVSTVTVSISGVTKATGAPAGTCDPTDFTLASTAMTVNAQIPVGSAQGAFTGATIKFNNKATNQDACKGATVALAYAVA